VIDWQIKFKPPEYWNLDSIQCPYHKAPYQKAREAYSCYTANLQKINNKY